ncbi:nucleoside triphosphate pyrophosphohydrolase family protein [Pseudomonas lopnurensis]|uniref:nucleoside triphosphate pyrophosphohydrolase family protein n=1 Tax=Pseudomonas lopnurensis TaxID=1477517 RepID=UPI0028B02047|nr:nucleoside triphosphate pyrophosphohydrolase family protein [Pseudomonas lopnurensis]
MAPAAVPRPTPLTLAQYTLKARESLRFKDDSDSLEIIRFGYFGEVGGLLSSVKKAGRDQLQQAQSEVAAEELGDALWYLAIAAHLLKITPDELGEACIRVLRIQFGESDKLPAIPVSFRQIDGLIDTRREDGTIHRSIQMGKLANSAGVLAEMSHGSLEVMAPPQRGSYFGKLLSELALTCASFNLLLEDVARYNLEKTASRWPAEKKREIELFDADFPEHEQLPRQFDIEFIERGTPEQGYVVQRLWGVYIGDRLTDNSNEVDNYRFHDVFHLAYAAYLGWSPVLRALLKRKRKSAPRKDENEDGARAMIIEEGIATWIFDHAKKRECYENIEPGSLDYGLLKQIQSMVRGYEVDQCKLWQWEFAILDGFRVFRLLREHRGGTVKVDITNSSLTFEPPSETKK